MRPLGNQIPKTVFSRQGPAILKTVNTTARLKPQELAYPDHTALSP
jgi:hypothetical protein